MLIRINPTSIKEININDFTTDDEYYKYIMQIMEKSFNSRNFF